MKTQLKGAQGEKRALKFLRRQQLSLLEKNFHCRYGEVDLIMQSQEQEIIFVEVRLRKNNDYGGAAASVTQSKQQKIIRTAQTYLQQHQLQQRPCRFDVVAICQGTQDIDWIQHAFC